MTAPHPDIHSAADARRLARRRQPRLVFEFIDGGAGEGAATLRNVAALAEIRLQPRGLRNVSRRRLSTTILGQPAGLPFGVAPMGMCNLSWPGADRALAAESRRREMPLCVSTAASTALEEMRRLAGDHAWFQLYAGGSETAALALADRAAAAGYETLVLTVDSPEVARRLRERRAGFRVPFRWGTRAAFDFALHPRWSAATLLAGRPRAANFAPSGDGGFQREESRGHADLAFFARLRDRWRGRLIVKGVTAPDDAVRIRNAGADAIYVSNHGGRQLESAPAAIRTLPTVRRAVGEGYPLLFDSGLRCGEDIVKAIAMGADFAMLGRAALFALGAGGARGLRSLLDGIAEEVDLTMAQIGARSIAEIGAAALAPPEAELAPRRPYSWRDDGKEERR